MIDRWEIMLNLSDIVVFGFNNSENTGKLLTHLGMIIHDNEYNQDNSYHIVYFDDDNKIDIAYNIDCRCILPIKYVEYERLIVFEKYESLIREEMAKLKTFSQEEKDMNEIYEYNETIKHNVCQLEREKEIILNRISDEEIENKLEKFCKLGKGIR